MDGLELTVAIGVAVLIGHALTRPTRLAVPVLLLVLGVVWGFAPMMREVHLPPEVMLFVFLPALLFWESLTTSLQSVRRDLVGILIMSTVLVVLTAGLGAVIGHAFGLSWPAAWVLGAAIAPTDATAVAALSRILPARDMTLLKAESLVNDGTALVIFGVSVAVLASSSVPTPGEIGLEVLISYVGGVLAGAVAAAMTILGYRVLREPLQQNLILVLAPFVAALLAELVHASAVLAVVVAGLAVSQFGARVTTAEGRQRAGRFWPLASTILNGALFVLIGIEFQNVTRVIPFDGLSVAIFCAVAVWLATWAVRFAFLLVLWGIGRAVRTSNPLLSIRACVVNASAGFRGAVSLATALAVPGVLDSGAPTTERAFIVFVAAGVVVLTICVQAPLLPLIVRWANLPVDDGFEEEYWTARTYAARAALDELPLISQRLRSSPEVAERVISEYHDRVRTLQHLPSGEKSAGSGRHHQYVALRVAAIERERDEAISLRERRVIDDATLLRLQAYYDAAEISLTPPDIED